MAFPWALARLLPSAVRVRIRSRSTSASPPKTASINRPVLLVLSAHGSAKDRNCALASTYPFLCIDRDAGGGHLAHQPVQADRIRLHLWLTLVGNFLVVHQRKFAKRRESLVQPVLFQQPGQLLA
jgi:hypothetical protein